MLSKAKEEIIIDNYVDKKLLNVLAKKKSVCVYTKSIDRNAIEKYEKQYANVKIEIRENIHDRFLILDRELLYHCGASFKDLEKNVLELIKLKIAIMYKY